MPTVTLLNAVAATGAGPAQRCGVGKRTLQCTISGTATCAIQVSNDNSTWVTLQSPTSTTAYEMDAPWEYIRGNVTAYTSGTVTLIMGVENIAQDKGVI